MNLLRRVLDRFAPACEHCSERFLGGGRCPFCHRHPEHEYPDETPEEWRERREAELRENFPLPPRTCDSCVQAKESTEYVPGTNLYICADCNPQRTEEPPE